VRKSARVDIRSDNIDNARSEPGAPTPLPCPDCGQAATRLRMVKSKQAPEAPARPAWLCSACGWFRIVPGTGGRERPES
jgi:hypothetical protein